MTPTLPRSALAGVLAAGAGLGAAELVAGLFSVRETPVEAVGAAFIDLVPPWMKDLAIQLFGTNDKLFLVILIVVLLGALSVAAGIIAAFRRGLGLVLLVVLAAVATLAAATRPGAGVTNALPSLAAGLVAVVLLPFLLDRFVPKRESDNGRRELLLNAGAVALGSLLAAGAGRLWLGRRLGLEDARSALNLPSPPTPQPPAIAELGLKGLSTWQTPNDTFYRIDTALSVPLVDPNEWRLKVHGMVEKPIELSLADLLKRPVVHSWATLACVSNEVGGDLIGNAQWSGVRIAEVLREAGPLAGADAVKSTSVDGWTCGTPLSVLTDARDSLLAFAMNGAPLPLEHGFPVRMVVPGLYGYVSATKWVVDIEVTRFDRFDAYWTPRGWDEQAPIKTQSRIDVPRSNATVPAGDVVVAGVAWAQHRGIDKVEVRVDEGPWQAARLAGEPTVDSWRQWTWQWTGATAGSYKLQVRATDAEGDTQTDQLAPPAPNGASGWHTVSVKVN
ncbi:molybdopterin-dependent oxidoreductase [Tenggerimyces flavus]|uniref:Molybdopterin-dependent oxidoreductase n=1 Tax=Tenggerimyces flavus TaxID=1708749 RepID=A0ABV7Y9U6_9ACTN|nr:molybdopterin-dependent oxidoreductase [Tenggerimyces flavus]MBM7785264.1 sulfite oxidase [Tenggerimyces flavus]